MENGNNANKNIAVLEQTSNKNNDIADGKSAGEPNGQPNETSASVPNGQPNENTPTEGKLLNIYKKKQWIGYKIFVYNTHGKQQLYQNSFVK